MSIFDFLCAQRYIDPKAEMVIARYASHTAAGNAANDPVTLPAYMALAKDLMAGG